MEFKVGDQVRLKGSGWGTASDPYYPGVYEGAVFPVSHHEGGWSWFTSPEDGDISINTGDFGAELVSVALNPLPEEDDQEGDESDDTRKSLTGLRVGDRVQLIGPFWFDGGVSNIPANHIVTVDRIDSYGRARWQCWNLEEGGDWYATHVSSDSDLVQTGADSMVDPVNHPAHYTSDPSGVECITITRHRSFNIGNAIKYLWRAGLKHDAALEDRAKEIEDLRKAIFYIENQIDLLRG